MEILGDVRSNYFLDYETRVGRGTDFGDGYGAIYPFMDSYGYSEGPDSPTKSGGSGRGRASGYGFAKGRGYAERGFGGDVRLRIKKLGKCNVIYINFIPTIIDRTCGNISKGRIVNERNFTTTPCYIARSGCYCAHGETPLKAVENLKDKLKR